MFLTLAQAAASTLPAALDWKHVLLATLIPVALLVGHRIGNSAAVAIEAKLKATGHPQAAQAFEFLASQLALVATETEKKAMAQAAQAQGLDHPAVDAALGKTS